MPIKDFLSIIFKLYGIHQLIQLILDVLRSLSNKYYGWELFGIMHFKGGTEIWLIYATFIFEAIIYLFLIFKTKRIINLFKIDTSLKSSNINFKELDNLDIIRNGIILIGIFLIVTNLTFFLRNIYLLFYQEVSGTIVELKKNHMETKNIDYMMWVISGTEILIGYLFIRKSNSIADWIIKLLSPKGERFGTDCKSA